MPTFRRPKNHEHPYAQISNDVLNDEHLSFKAKGILSYLLARPDDWETYQSHLADLGPDGEHAVRSGIKELREAGYLERTVVRGEDGQYEGYEYIVYEHPSSPRLPEGEAPESQDPENDSPEMGFSDSGERHPTNTESTKTDSTKSGGSSAPAPAREGAGSMPDDLLPLYDTYQPEVDALLERYTPDRADELVSNQWGQIGVSQSIMRLAKREEWTYFVAGVVITANEADSPNARYLDTLLTAITDLDEHTDDDPSQQEQESNLERLFNAARGA